MCTSLRLKESTPPPQVGGASERTGKRHSSDAICSEPCQRSSEAPAATAEEGPKTKRSKKEKKREKQERLEVLRRERRRREEAERRRTETVLLRREGGGTAEEGERGKAEEGEGRGRYNSQFNPHLARQSRH